MNVIKMHSQLYRAREAAQDDGHRRRWLNSLSPRHRRLHERIDRGEVFPWCSQCVADEMNASLERVHAARRAFKPDEEPDRSQPGWGDKDLMP